MKRILFIEGVIISILFLISSQCFCNNSLFREIKKAEYEQFLLKGSLDTTIQLLNQVCSNHVLFKEWGLLIKNKLLLSEILSRNGDFEGSKAEVYSCLNLAEKYSDTNSQLYCIIRYTIGNLSIEWGQLKNAKNNLEIARNILDRSFREYDSLLFLIHYKTGTYYYFLNEFDSALHFYRNAFELIKYSSSSQEERFKCLQSIGIIYTVQGKYRDAETYLLNSSILSEIIYKNDLNKQSYTHLNLGKFYEHLDQHKEALNHLNAAELMAIKMINPNLHVLFRVYWNKGISLLQLEELTKAQFYLEKAFEISSKLYADNYTFQFPLFMDLAYCYEKNGNSSLAEYYYMICLKSDDLILKNKVYKNLGKLYSNRKQDDLAMSMYNSALRTINQSHTLDSLTIAHTYMRYGEFLLYKGNIVGMTYLEKAKDIYSKFIGMHNKDIGLICKIIGDFYYNRRNNKEAINSYVEALQSFKINKRDSFFSMMLDSDKIILDPLAITIIRNLSCSLLMEYNTSHELELIINSVNTYEICAQYLLNLLALFNERQTFIENNAKYESLYEEAISACRVAYCATGDSSYLIKAFDFAERNKSMNLLITLKDEMAKEIGNIPSSLREKEREIKLSRNIYNQAIYEEGKKSSPDQNKISYLTEKMLALESEYSSLLDVLEREYPDYYRMKYDFSTSGVRQVQQMLQKDEMMLEYTFGKDSLYIFSITKNTYSVISVKADSSIIEDIFALRENLWPLDIVDYDKDDFHDFQVRSKRLYKQLLEPFDNIQGIKRMIVVPDDELGYLSYDLLVEDKPFEKEIRFTNLPFMVRKYSISYAPSASLLEYQLNSNQEYSSSGLLGFAPMYNAEKDFQLQAGIKSLFRTDENLPGAVEEIKSIPKRYFGRKCFKEEATEQNFKRLAGEFDILHLAMHTQVNDEYPLTSELKFYPLPDSVEDGVLHTYEIFSLKLKSRMVVLSACSSGSGKLEKGEGINSLARAFLYAGSNSVVMTLWDVEDNASRKLINFFYDKIAEGLHKDEALRQAKLEYLSEIKHVRAGHPFFWAGYVVYGNTAPIHYPAISYGRFKSELPWFALTLIFVISLGLWYRKYRKKRRRKYAWSRRSTLKVLKTK
jgi:CHAT domain-containing protein